MTDTAEKRSAPRGASSLWRPLRVPTFRNLLAANVVSDIGTFMQSVGAAWLMVSLHAGPIYVALTQTASSLPFFLLSLPAGSAGDIVDRRKLILATEAWMAGVAFLLCVLTIAGFMSPWLLLVLTFALSAGDAFETPSWRAILPELVPKEELAAASSTERDRVQSCPSSWTRARRPSHRRHRSGHGIRGKFRIVFRSHSGGCEVEEACSQADHATGIVRRSHGCRDSLRPLLTRNSHRGGSNRRSHIFLERDCLPYCQRLPTA